MKEERIVSARDIFCMGMQSIQQRWKGNQASVDHSAWFHPLNHLSNNGEGRGRGRNPRRRRGCDTSLRAKLLPLLRGTCLRRSTDRRTSSFRRIQRIQSALEQKKKNGSSCIGSARFLLGARKTIDRSRSAAFRTPRSALVFCLRRRFLSRPSRTRDGVRVERFFERRRRSRRGRLDRHPRRLSMLALQLHLPREGRSRRAPVSRPRRAPLRDGSFNRRFRRLTSSAMGRHRSSDTHDIDLKRIFTEICDDLYDRMKLVNFVRSQAARGKAIRNEQLLSKVGVSFGSHRFDVWMERTYVHPFPIEIST